MRILQQALQRLFEHIGLQALQLRQTCRQTPIARGGKRVKYAPAAKGSLRRLVAQNQTIAVHGMHRRIQQQLRKTLLARLQAAAFKQRHPPGNILRAEVHMHRRPVAEFARLAGQQLQLNIQSRGGCMQLRGQQPVTTAHMLQRQPLAGNVEGYALPCPCLFGGLILRMQATHSHAAAAGTEQQFIAHLHPPGKGGSGDDHARAGY